MQGEMSVAVVGGGLGGTVAAILLEQAGYVVRVYEQAPRLARIGAGIHLSPNATCVIRGCGLLDIMIRQALLPHHMDQREWDTGEITFVLRYHEFPARYGLPHVIMHRGDLQVLLNSGLKPGTLALGKELLGFDESNDKVKLTFADGSRAEADIVIGADGINSKVRELLLGPEAPSYTGRVAHRAIFPASRMSGLRLADASKWWAEDRYFMNYYLTPARDELYIVTGAPVTWQGDDFTPQPADMRELRAMFEGFHPEVQRMLEACPGDGALTWPVLYRDPRPLWSSGRTVLLGDACHPMQPHMGQGAAMALEDAAMLVRCLEHCGGEFAAAFRLYEAQRFERTTRVKLESDKHEWMRHGSPCDWLFGYDVFSVPMVITGLENGSSALRPPDIATNYARGTSA
jgi:6-hydroxynicotinate 3-monooxygenase